MNLRLVFLGTVVSAILASGCGTLTRGLDRIVPDRRTEYQQAESLPDLEVPPELSIDAIQDRMAIPQASAAADNATFQERAEDSRRPDSSAPQDQPAPTPIGTAGTVDARRPGAVVPEGAETPQRAELIGANSGKAYILLHEPVGTAWNNVESALHGDESMKIEDSDPDRGTFRVRFTATEAPEEKEGLLSRMAFWRNDAKPGTYQVRLTEVGEETEIVILDADGAWDTSAPAGQLLADLHARLR